MKIAVVCANEEAGKLIVKEVVERGIDVTVIAKGKKKALHLVISRKTYSI